MIDRPIFVLGCPRSGTTLLRSILDAHPRICCPEWETGVFVALAQMLDRDGQWHAANDSLIGDLRPRMLAWARHSVVEMMDKLTEGVDKPRWAEKTPAHVLHVRLIHEVFPESQIIHIIRNGKDVVRSLQSMPWTPRKIRWNTRWWIETVNTGRRQGAELSPSHYKEVRYEDLTQHPKSTVEALCGFLGESFVDSMLEFHKPEQNSWGSSGQPISSTPVNKHKELGWLERIQFQRLAGPLQRELGYQ